MNTLLNLTDLIKAKSFIGKIRTRTWVILGGVVIGILGLLIWIAVSLMSWLWGQASAGVGLADNALSRTEQLLPGLRERAQQLAPALTAEALALRDQAQRLAPELAKSAEQLIPNLSLSESTFSDAIPLVDVSGIDIGPVARFPGLVRSAFSRSGETIKVDYQGKAAVDTVVGHYTKGFVMAGFAHEVMQATTKSELHKFTDQTSAITLAVEQLAPDSVSVQLTSSR